MLSIEKVVAGYGTKPVLHGVSVDVVDGEFLGLIGPNGSGKTTLLRAISGVVVPREGRVLLRGVDLQDISRRRLAQTMALLPQDLALDFSFTVREVTLMGRSPHLPRFGYETRRDLEIVERAMELTDVAHLADRIITETSGGERQRVFIAMCLAQEPELLVLDEPTNHLDIAHQLYCLDLIRKLNRQTGMTVISVFHDLNLAAEYCDRLVVLDHGRVEALGPPEEVLTAEMILRVFGVRVSVQRNGISDKPHIAVSAEINSANSGRGMAAAATEPV
jgi:iron complex transport system ATP-binding protein